MKLFSLLLAAVTAKHCNPTIPTGGDAAPADVDPQPGKKDNLSNICYMTICKIWLHYYFSNGRAIRMYKRKWNLWSSRKMWLFLPMWSQQWSQVGNARESRTLLGCTNWWSELDQFHQLRQRTKSTMWARSWTMTKCKQSWSSQVWVYRLWRSWYNCCLCTAITC